MENVQREKKLIFQGSPCNVNYFDRGLLTVQQAMSKGDTYCPNLEECGKPTNKIYCLLRSGLEVAQYVSRGSTLEKEMQEFSGADFLESECRTSLDGKNFVIIKGKAKVLDAVERFARTVLLMNPSESVFPRCGNCYGVKLTKDVFDSIHDGPFSLSGSGKTIRRAVEYCPECDSEPEGEFLKKDPRDEEEFRIIRKMNDKDNFS